MYQCLSFDFREVEKRIKSTIRLMEKYGYSAEYKVFNEEVKEIPVYRIDNITKTKIKIGTTLAKVTNYDFIMPDFKVGNYIPVAVIEHDVVPNDDFTSNMVHLINGFENAPKSWWTISGHCDDCNDSYNRKKTIMLQDIETKMFRQIGTGCLKKYLGINVYNVINGFGSISEILEEEVAIYSDYLPDNKYVNTQRFLGLVIDEINKNGYIKDRVTSHRAFTAITERNEYPSEKAVEQAKIIYNFFKNIDVEFKVMNNDFYMNIRTAVLSDYIGDSALIGYAPLAYDKILNFLNKQNEEVARKSNSQYVGNVGDKITINVEVVKCIGFESNYGYSYVNIFEEADTHNELVWITSSAALTVGSKMKIKGTVKQHKEYEGTKQTVLTRVKEIA